MAYYGRRIPNQTKGVVTRPTAGLNEYNPASEVNDNYLTDCIDVEPYRLHALEFWGETVLAKILATHGDNIGTVRAVLASDASIDEEYTYTFYVLTLHRTTGWRILKVYYSPTSTSITTYAMTTTSSAYSASIEASAAIFKTEVETYYCFIISSDQRIHSVTSGGVYINEPIPFTPKKMVAHANRLFIIDTRNVLWWCRAGDMFSWYAAGYDDDGISASQNMANGAYTITSQPNVLRYITFSHTVVDTVDTLGSIALVGITASGSSDSETITLQAGGRVVSKRQYSSVTSATQADWVIGGTTADTILIGVGPIGPIQLLADAGYWTFEEEPYLVDLCVLGSSIYIFGENNIYIFRGTSPDTFSKQSIISGIGCKQLENSFGYSTLTVSSNVAYFIYEGSVYQFDGNSMPRIISRPVIVNNASTNGVFGGIAPFTNASWVVSSDVYNLYVYNNTVGLNTSYYVYEFETKTWWKKSGLTKTDVGTANNIYLRFVPSYTKIRTILFVTIDDAASPTWFFSFALGIRQGTTVPFITTKAYNTGASDEGTLTELVLLVKGTNADTATIKVWYSLKESGTDFTAIETFTNYVMNSDIQVIKIYMPSGFVARAHHYRIKVQVTPGTHPVYLYDIERRFRVIGRSR